MPTSETVAAAPTLPGWPAAMNRKLVAGYIGMSTRWIDQQVSAGAFPPGMKFGKSTRWLRADVDGWLQSRKGER